MSPENTTNAPQTPVAQETPGTFSDTTPTRETASNVMQATPIENGEKRRSNILVWIGFGVILIAIIIAGTYYYMTRVQPDVTPEVPQVAVPVETDEERAVNALEAIDQTLNEVSDLDDVTLELDSVTEDLGTVQ